MAHPYWPLFDLRVRTPGLELRVPDDALLGDLADLIAAGLHDPDVMPFSIPFTDPPSPRRERESFQHWWRQRADWSPEKWSLCLAVIEHGTVVGVQDLNAEHFATLRSVETGSWLGRPHQGRGIGTDMRAAVLHLAFAGLGAHEALSGAFVDNPTSLAVSRKLGYADNGTRRVRQRDAPGTIQELRLDRETWSTGRRDDITIDGLAQCLAFFGLDADGRADPSAWDRGPDPDPDP